MLAAVGCGPPAIQPRSASQPATSSGAVKPQWVLPASSTIAVVRFAAGHHVLVLLLLLHDHEAVAVRVDRDDLRAVHLSLRREVLLQLLVRLLVVGHALDRRVDARVVVGDADVADALTAVELVRGEDQVREAVGHEDHVGHDEVLGQRRHGLDLIEPRLLGRRAERDGCEHARAGVHGGGDLGGGEPRREARRRQARRAARQRAARYGVADRVVDEAQVDGAVPGAAARERAADRVGAHRLDVELLDVLRGDDAAQAEPVDDHVVRLSEIVLEDLPAAG